MVRRTASRVASFSRHLIHAQLFRLERLQQSNSNGLDPFDIGRDQLVFLQEVENGQRFLVEAFSHCAALFVVKLLDEFQQGLERLLDRNLVLVPVVVRDDLFVVPLKVGAKRVLLKEPPQPKLDDVA